MVKGRLLQPDAQENGWLLDGYPRSYSQAMALETLGIRPDTFLLLDVSVQLDQINDT
jgi:adenylate kinase